MENDMTSKETNIRDKIVLFDDEHENAKYWMEMLTPILGSERMLACETDRLRQDVTELEDRRASARAGDEPSESDYAGTIFDQAEILVVDFDLFDVDRTLDGNHVAYLARCFSRAGLIIGVNQDDTDAWYDLTLTDHPMAFTDLSVGGSHLATRSLWQPATTDDNEPQFSPWHWPHLLQAAGEYEECVKRVESAADDTRLPELVAIDSNHVGLLNRDVLMPISPRHASPPRAAILGELLKLTPMGLPFVKDKAPSLTQARVRAARVRHWLEAILLPRQDLLADAPHVLSQMPGLVATGDYDTNRRAACRRHEAPKSLGIDYEVLAEYAGPGAPWISRPTWWRPDYISADALDDRRVPRANDQPVVFCEDVSAFFDPEGCKRFKSDTGGTTTQRWVKYVRGKDGKPIADYEPAGRLLT
jgi:hypothetical protein